MNEVCSARSQARCSVYLFIVNLDQFEEACNAFEYEWLEAPTPTRNVNLELTVRTAVKCSGSGSDSVVNDVCRHKFR